MSDTKQPGAFDGPKSAWKNPKARKGMLMVGGIAVVVVGVAFSLTSKDSRDQQSLPASAQITPPPFVLQGDPASPTSEKYKEMVKEADQQRLVEAEKTPGAMVLPKIAGLSDPNQKAASGPVMSADVVRQQQTAGYAPAANQMQGAEISPQDRARMSPTYKAVSEMLTKIVSREMEPERDWVAVRPPASAAAPAIANQNSMQQGAPGQMANFGGGSSAPQFPIISMGTTHFATLDTAINTDYSGSIKATLREGKYAGAQLLGSKTLEFDAVVLKFNLMSLNNGTAAIPINAYAVTIDDAKKFGLTGIKGDVDYHVMQRWIAPAAMAFIAGYGQVTRMPSQSIVSTPTGTTQTTDKLEKRDRLIAAAGEAVEPLSKDLQRLAARPITIKVDSNTEIGIMFTSDVIVPRDPIAAQQLAAQPQDSLTPQQQYAQAQQQMLKQQQQRVPDMQQPNRMGYGYPNYQAQPAIR